MSHETTPLPVRLRVVGATDLEQRLLDAAAREAPSEALTRRMEQALGITVAAAVAAGVLEGAAGGAGRVAGTKAGGAAAGGAASATVGTVWPWVSGGLVALALAGAVIGTRWLSRRPTTPAAPEISAPLAAPPIAAPPVTGESADQPAERATAPRLHVAAHHRVTAAAATVPNDELRAEIGQIDAARAAVAAHQDGQALALLRRYDAAHPTGTFRPEAAALRIEALVHLGRTAEARTQARTFVATHPDSPLAARVARLTDVDD